MLRVCFVGVSCAIRVIGLLVRCVRMYDSSSFFFSSLISFLSLLLSPYTLTMLLDVGAMPMLCVHALEHKYTHTAYIHSTQCVVYFPKRSYFFSFLLAQPSDNLAEGEIVPNRIV